MRRSLDDTEIEQEGFIEAQSQAKYIRTAKTRVIESEISSYLALQVLVFHNWYYSVLMVVILYSTNLYKLNMFEHDYIFVDFIAITVFALAEFIRLYFGFSGNINESFPSLIAFLVISVLFTAPTLIYQWAAINVVLPIDYAVGIIQWLFLLAEVLLGIVAIKRLVKKQTAIFFLRNSHPDLYYRVTYI